MLYLAQEFLLDFVVRTNCTDWNQNSSCRTAIRSSQQHIQSDYTNAYVVDSKPGRWQHQCNKQQQMAVSLVMAV